MLMIKHDEEGLKRGSSLLLRKANPSNYTSNKGSTKGMGWQRRS